MLSFFPYGFMRPYTIISCPAHNILATPGMLNHRQEKRACPKDCSSASTASTYRPRPLPPRPPQPFQPTSTTLPLRQTGTPEDRES